jgi:hypothetical protein
MLLQKWQTNEIFKGIQSVSLNPQEFEFEDSGAEARLKHKWSDSYFVIGRNAGLYVGRHVVGDGFDWPYEEYSWQSLMRRFSGWVKEVKDDLDTPDLWAELRRDAELLGRISGETHGNTPFTSEEQKDIEQRLRKVEAHVRGTYFSLNPRRKPYRGRLTTSLTQPVASVGSIEPPSSLERWFVTFSKSGFR